MTTSEAPDLPAALEVLHVASDGDEADAPGARAAALDAIELPDADTLAVAIFTSGTTGQPKGITHTHGDIVAAARRVAAGYARLFEPGERVMSPETGYIITDLLRAAGVEDPSRYLSALVHTTIDRALTETAPSIGDGPTALP